METMYRLTSEQQAVVERAREIAEQHIAPRSVKVDEEERFPGESINALTRGGLLGLTVPIEYGGMGQGARLACAVLDEVAQRCASTAMIYMMHLCGIACYAARPDRAGDQLRAAAEGRHLSTLAWSERGSGSHFWMPVSREIREDGYVHLRAEKSFVTSAGHADGYVVSVGCGQVEQPTRSMLYLVLKGDAGFTVEGAWRGLGLRGNASSPMRLNVKLAPERALSEDGRGLEMMIGVVLPLFQLCNAAICVGIAEAAVQATQKHLTTKRLEHLDRTLAEQPHQRARLAQMRIEVDRSRAHLVATADAVERAAAAMQLLVLETKAVANEAAVAVTDKAMRACGGSAFRRDLGIERLFRDARAPIVMAPTTDQAQEFIGRFLCGMEVLA